ncbi:MAG: S8 family serine peptidase [Bacteroidia bacterium]
MKFILSLLLCLPLSLSAQDVYLVYFKDKVGSQYDPYETLDSKAIERRLREGLDLCDESDWPVSGDYLAQVEQTEAIIRHPLRWFNAVSVQASPAAITQIESLSCVRKTEALGQMQLSQGGALAAVQVNAEKILKAQRKQMELDYFVEQGLSGAGVRIAIFDVGFSGVNIAPGFEHLYENDQIIATRDFYGGDDNAYAHGRHGTSVLGCIAGKYGKDLIGAAPKAEFLLARTEHGLFEKLVEEDHWLAAMEWADQNGADIISSSLGYTKKRYTTAQMDGKTAPVSRAAGLAADKGILVVNAAGNDGDKDWRYLNAPADQPKILTIGGTEAELPIHISFGSYGPNALKQRKPNLSAPGHVASLNGLSPISETYGTSFSTPLVSGFAACVKERFPDLALRELFLKLEQSGHLYPYYDYAHGYGVPQASKAVGPKTKQYSNPAKFDVQLAGDKAIVLLKESAAKRSAKQRSIYYHYEHPDRSHLIDYNFRVLKPGADGYSFPLPTPISDPSRKGMLRIWMDGYLWEKEW